MTLIEGARLFSFSFPLSLIFYFCDAFTYIHVYVYNNCDEARANKRQDKRENELTETKIKMRFFKHIYTKGF